MLKNEKKGPTKLPTWVRVARFLLVYCTVGVITGLCVVLSCLVDAGLSRVRDLQRQKALSLREWFTVLNDAVVVVVFSLTLGWLWASVLTTASIVGELNINLD